MKLSKTKTLNENMHLLGTIKANKEWSFGEYKSSEQINGLPCPHFSLSLSCKIYTTSGGKINR